MPTSEERIKILTMVQEGILTPEQAAQLLEALGAGEQAAPGPYEPPAPRGMQQPRPPMPPGVPMPPGMPAPSGIPVPPDDPTALPGRRPRWLRVRVTDTETGRPRVNVRLPVSMVSFGLKMGSRFSPQVEGLDADQLARIIEAGEVGQIVDVIDDEDGEHVEVFLE